MQNMTVNVHAVARRNVVCGSTLHKMESIGNNMTTTTSGLFWSNLTVAPDDLSMSHPATE
jgi:hypothetical protein